MKIHYYKPRFLLISLGLLVSTFPALASPVSAAGNAIVSVSAPPSVVAGSQFTISINVQPNNAIAGAQFNLAFNPSLVTVNSLTEGNLFKQNGASTYFMPGQINNTAGSIAAVACVVTSPGQTVSAAGTLATISMTAKSSEGTCPLTLSSVVVGNINGQEVSSSKTDSQVIIILPHAPVLATIGNKVVNEGTLLSLAVSATDAGGGTLTYSASNLPSGANFYASNRTFNWTPNFDQAGIFPNVRFQVSDGDLTDSEDITITVNDVNRAPVLTVIGNKSVNEGGLLTFTVSATDPDLQTLTYTASNLPAGASFSGSTRTFSWTPNYAQAGTYSNIRFEVTDGSLVASEIITITVIQPYPDWDLNQDSRVNVLDLVIVSQHWGETGIVAWMVADANHDGLINVLDAIMIGQHWTG